MGERKPLPTTQAVASSPSQPRCYPPPSACRQQRGRIFQTKQNIFTVACILQCFSHSFILLYPATSCLPDPFDGLGQTNVSRLKLVQRQTDHDGGRIETPGEDFAGAWCALLGDVIGDDVLESGVRVDEEGGAQEGIEGRVQRASGKWRDGQRDKGGSDEPVKGPVVGAVRGRGLRYGRRVVYYKSRG